LFGADAYCVRRRGIVQASMYYDDDDRDDPCDDWWPREMKNAVEWALTLARGRAMQTELQTVLRQNFVAAYLAMGDERDEVLSDAAAAYFALMEGAIRKLNASGPPRKRRGRPSARRRARAAAQTAVAFEERGERHRETAAASHALPKAGRSKRRR
jgi:hypothetical protein